MDYITVNLCGGPRDGETFNIESHMYPHSTLRLIDPDYKPIIMKTIEFVDFLMPKCLVYEFSLHHPPWNMYFAGIS